MSDKVFLEKLEQKSSQPEQPMEQVPLQEDVHRPMTSVPAHPECAWIEIASASIQAPTSHAMSFAAPTELRVEPRSSKRGIASRIGKLFGKAFSRKGHREQIPKAQVVDRV